ncbi:hypothetical protein [Flavobacterium frigoris]|uniref:Uncharacterized protein n=1 Tax=Flavobacterium frigoris TaxID=229204 RepID=A0A1H9RU71_FLAFI|nr:hypothetical protein [Flavobacterium frigoris]SER76410.1 hypothetical protein SAMN05444355_1257 [Flavobacterium frigoris]
MKNITKEVKPFDENKKVFFKTFRFSQKEINEFEIQATEGNYQNTTKMIKDIIINKKYRTITIDLEARKNTIELLTEVRKIAVEYKIIANNMNTQNIESFSSEEKTELINLLFKTTTLYSSIKEKVSRL